MKNSPGKLRKVIFQNFDNLVKACKEIAAKWNRKDIPLVVLKESINTIKQKNYSHQDPSIVKMYDDYNRVLDSLYSTCEKAAQGVESGSVSVEFLELCIETIKKNVNKGAGI